MLWNDIGPAPAKTNAVASISEVGSLCGTHTHTHTHTHTQVWETLFKRPYQSFFDFSPLAEIDLSSTNIVEIQQCVSSPPPSNTAQSEPLHTRAAAASTSVDHQDQLIVSQHKHLPQHRDTDRDHFHLMREEDTQQISWISVYTVPCHCCDGPLFQKDELISCLLLKWENKHFEIRFDAATLRSMRTAVSIHVVLLSAVIQLYILYTWTQQQQQSSSHPLKHMITTSLWLLWLADCSLSLCLCVQSAFPSHSFNEESSHWKGWRFTGNTGSLLWC